MGKNSHIGALYRLIVGYRRQRGHLIWPNGQAFDTSVRLAKDEQLGLKATKQLNDKGLSVKFHYLAITNAENRQKTL